MRFAKARALWREQGPVEVGRRTLAFVWRRSLRRVMPVRRSVYWSGVRVHEVRAFDGVLGPGRGQRQPKDTPDYEDALVDGLQTLVRSGDRVVVVGGGFGVTSVVAAQAAGTGGVVWCYEESASRLPWIRSTCALNRTLKPMAPVRIVHARVANERPGTDDGDVRVIEPTSLPPCDVLELDCEGSELEILNAMTIRPRALVVEAHGVFGAPTDVVRKAIEFRGYSVLHVRLAEERLGDLHVSQDVRVITAVLREAPAATG